MSTAKRDAADSRSARNDIARNRMKALDFFDYGMDADCNVFLSGVMMKTLELLAASPGVDDRLLPADPCFVSSQEGRW